MMAICSLIWKQDYPESSALMGLILPPPGLQIFKAQLTPCFLAANISRAPSFGTQPLASQSPPASFLTAKLVPQAMDITAPGSSPSEAANFVTLRLEKKCKGEMQMNRWRQSSQKICLVFHPLLHIPG